MRKMSRFEAGKLGGKRRVELYGGPSTPAGSRLGGLISGIRYPERIHNAATTESRRAGALALSREDRAKGGRAASHVHWHVNRNRPNPLCELCEAEQKSSFPSASGEVDLPQVSETIAGPQQEFREDFRGTATREQQ